MQNLNIDAARKHGLEAGIQGPPTTGTPSMSLNTPDILNTLISITNPFFESSPLIQANTSSDPQNPGGVVDEEKKVFATLETPVVPKFPVQSVDQTRSHLIKESLKMAIQTKRKFSGKEELDVKSELEAKMRKREEVVLLNSIETESQAPNKVQLSHHHHHHLSNQSFQFSCSSEFLFCEFHFIFHD